jgi:hypothetical protein
VLQLGNQLTKMGHEIHWLTARIPNTKEYELYHGIHIHRIPILFKNRFYFPGRQTFPFMVMLQKLDFLRQMDVIQTNTLVAGYTGWRLAKNITNLPSSFAMKSMVHFGIRWEVRCSKEGCIQRSKCE